MQGRSPPNRKPGYLLLQPLAPRSAPFPPALFAPRCCCRQVCFLSCFVLSIPCWLADPYLHKSRRKQKQKRKQRNKHRERQGNQTDIHTLANIADPNTTQITWPSKFFLLNGLQPLRNTFVSILRRLRGSGPGSERGGGDSCSSISGHSSLRSRSA